MGRRYQLLFVILLALSSGSVAAQGLGSLGYGVTTRCWSGKIGSAYVRFCAQQETASVKGQIFVDFEDQNGTRQAAPGSPRSFSAPIKSDGSFDLWPEQRKRYTKLRIQGNHLTGERHNDDASTFHLF
jgi:hypothetical protein